MGGSRWLAKSPKHQSDELIAGWKDLSSGNLK
jgi:hypothetical protein